MKTYNITVNGKTYEVSVEEKCGTSKAAPVGAQPAFVVGISSQVVPKPVIAGGKSVTAPMPGKVISIKVNLGDVVKADQELIIMEAMKMHNPILAPSNGVVKEILVKTGDAVQTGNVLVVLG